MRRNDKEITDRKLIEEILNKSKCCRLALVNDNKPYIVPMNFAYKDNCIFLHSAMEGTKIGILTKNNNVCFEIDESVEILENELACNWTCKFLSVIGFGHAEILLEEEEKIRGLDIIMKKYSGRTNHLYSKKALDNILIIKINIKSITGKKSRI